MQGRLEKAKTWWRYVYTWKWLRLGPSFETLWERSRTLRFGKAGMSTDVAANRYPRIVLLVWWFRRSRLQTNINGTTSGGDRWLVTGCGRHFRRMTEMFPVCKNMTHTWRTFFIDWATQLVSDAIQLFLQRWWRHNDRQHYVMSRTCSCLFFSSTPYVSAVDSRLARHRSPADRTPLSIWPNTIDASPSFHRTMDISSSCIVMSPLWFYMTMDRF